MADIKKNNAQRRKHASQVRLAIDGPKEWKQTGGVALQ